MASEDYVWLLKQFVDPVIEMRQLQRSYFAGRTPEALHRAKKAEARVDALAKQIVDKRYSEGEQ